MATQIEIPVCQLALWERRNPFLKGLFLFIRIFANYKIKTKLHICSRPLERSRGEKSSSEQIIPVKVYAENLPFEKEFFDATVMTDSYIFLTETWDILKKSIFRSLKVRFGPIAWNRINEYAIGDRKSMEAGGGKYLNFIKIVLRKK